MPDMPQTPARHYLAIEFGKSTHMISICPSPLHGDVVRLTCFKHLDVGSKFKRFSNSHARIRFNVSMSHVAVCK